jgi:hypothetical protein
VLLLPGLIGASSRCGQQPSSDSDEPFIRAYREAEPITTWPLKRVLHEIPEIKRMAPAADQSSLPGTLAQAAQRLETFWADFQNTSSLETIELSRQLDKPAANTDQAVQQFRYLMLTDPGNTLAIKEYRTDMQGRERDSEAASGFVKTSGFTSLPLVFGERQQALCDFRDLGSQSIRRQTYRVIAFAQHVDPSAFSRWHLQDRQVPILIQGVAWIDPASGQVVQMRTDLLAAQPTVMLQRATTFVTLAPVTFHSSQHALWLPQEVTVTVDFAGYTFINKHSYSEYRLFTVNTDQRNASAKSP